MNQTGRESICNLQAGQYDQPDLPRPSPKLMPSDILPPTTQSSKAPLCVLLLLAFAPCSAMMLLYCLHWQSQIATQGLPISIN